LLPDWDKKIFLVNLRKEQIRNSSDIDTDRHQRKKKDGPLDILKKRFAAGEIHIIEYQEKKKMLEKS
jgi:uncharacterized membrane protein